MRANRRLALFNTFLAAALASLLGCGAANALTVEARPSFEADTAVSDAELDQMRGGFEVSLNGMQFLLAFSIERLSYINGELVASTYFNVMELLKGATLSQATTRTTHAPATQPERADLDPVTATARASREPRTAANHAQMDSAYPQVDSVNGVTRIQNGPGNSFQIPASLNSFLTTVIQNTVDNQVLQNMTILNATLATRGLAAAAQLSEALSRGIAASAR